MSTSTSPENEFVLIYGVTPDDITQFLNHRREKDENSVVRGSVEWAQQTCHDYRE